MNPKIVAAEQANDYKVDKMVKPMIYGAVNSDFQ